MTRYIRTIHSVDGDETKTFVQHFISRAQAVIG